MSKYKRLLDSFKDLFLDELLVDPGWSAYIDLLLRNIDVSSLSLCRANGFPYEFHLSDYFSRIPGTPPIFSSEVFDVQYSNGELTLTYPKVGGARLDFGEVTLEFNRDGLLSLSYLEDNKWVTLYSFDSNEGVTFGEPVIELREDVSFRVVIQDVKPDGTTYDVYSTLLLLPNQINPNSILFYKSYNMMLVDEDATLTSPQALFGALAKILAPVRFYIVLSKDNGGTRQLSLPEYVSLYNKEFHDLESEDKTYITAVTGSKVPLDALRDKIGYGSQESDIVGYDKNYVVFFDNKGDTNLIALQADSGVVSDGIKVVPNSILFPNRLESTEALLPPTLELIRVYKETVTSTFSVDPSSVSFNQRAESNLISVSADGEYSGSWAATSGVSSREEISSKSTKEVWVFEMRLITNDPRAVGSSLGRLVDGSKVLDYGPGTSTVIPVRLSNVVEGSKVTFWASSSGTQGVPDSETVLLEVTVEVGPIEPPTELNPPILSLSWYTTEVYNKIFASWTESVGAEQYEVFYREEGSQSWISAGKVSKLSLNFEVPSITTYEVYVVASASGFDPVSSDAVSVTLGGYKLPSPVIKWRFSDFPNTSLSVGAIDHAASYWFFIEYPDGETTEERQCAPGMNENIAQVRPGKNTITVYAKAQPGFTDSWWSSETLNALKLPTPSVSVSEISPGVVLVSWDFIEEAMDYLVSLDSGEPQSVSGPIQMEVSPGEHTVSVVAQNVEGFYFDSDPGTLTFSYPIVSLLRAMRAPDGLVLSKSSITFPQRESTDTVDLIYNGNWIVGEPAPTPKLTADVVVTTTPSQPFNVQNSQYYQGGTVPSLFDGKHKYLVARKGSGFALLCSPESEIAKTEYGVIKNYSMLTVGEGRLVSVDLYIEDLRSSVQEMFGDRFEALIDSLKDILSKSVPVGVGVTINFVYPMIESTLKLDDSFSGRMASIYINGKPGTSYISFGNLSEEGKVVIDTIPVVLPWSVK